MDVGFFSDWLQFILLTLGLAAAFGKAMMEQRYQTAAILRLEKTIHGENMDNGMLGELREHDKRISIIENKLI